MPGASHHRPLHLPFRKRPSLVRTGVADGVIGATGIEEGNLAPFRLDRFGRSGQYVVGFRDFDELSHLAGLL